MTAWMRCRVSAETGRLPLSAYDTVLRATPERRAISPMFIALRARVVESVNRFEVYGRRDIAAAAAIACLSGL